MITSYDLKQLFKKYQRTIYRVAFLCAAFGFLTASVFKVKFRANASFKYEGQKEDSAMSAETFVKSLADMGSSQDLKPYFQSRAILGPVVDELGLQIISYEKPLIPRLFQRAFDNIKAELRIYLDPEDAFRFSHVHTDHERKQCYFLKFSDGKHYELFDDQKKF